MNSVHPSLQLLPSLLQSLSVFVSLYACFPYYLLLLLRHSIQTLVIFCFLFLFRQRFFVLLFSSLYIVYDVVPCLWQKNDYVQQSKKDYNKYVVDTYGLLKPNNCESFSFWKKDDDCKMLSFSWPGQARPRPTRAKLYNVSSKEAEYIYTI